ncbi:MAG: histidine phosphatase family protein [bacterium]
MQTIFLARHGQTEYNAKGWLQGHNDSPLTEMGQQQAKELGLKIQGLKFDKIYSSDLGRALATAYLAINEGDVEGIINLDKRLRELDFGQLSGKPVDSIMVEGMHYTENKDFVYPDGESFNQLIQRLDGFWTELNQQSHKGFLVVAHSGVVRASLGILGINRYQIRQERLPNGFLAKIIIENGSVKDYQEL